jgi:PHD/YefM family antitoxin component YafN of YafNO toxin-antitoxin module
MILPSDIHTLDSFRRQSKLHVDRLKESGRPEVLTVNGKAAVVVQDAAAYQAQMEKIEVLEALAESVRQAEAGQVKEARPAIRALVDELRRKRS